MKRLLTKYGVIVLSLAVVIAVILSVMAYFSTSAAPLPNVAGIIVSPFRSAGAAITETVSGWVDYFTEFDALKEENEQLKLEIAEMETAIRQAESYRFMLEHLPMTFPEEQEFFGVANFRHKVVQFNGRAEFYFLYFYRHLLVRLLFFRFFIHILAVIQNSADWRFGSGRHFKQIQTVAPCNCQCFVGCHNPQLFPVRTYDSNFRSSYSLIFSGTEIFSGLIIKRAFFCASVVGSDICHLVYVIIF